MAQTFVTIRGIDPLLFRDGKPFTADAGGLTARSLPLPLPSTVAAFVRSQIGKAEGRAGRRWTDDECRDAHAIPVHGPLLARDGNILLAPPRDAVLAEIPGDASHARPRRLTPTEPSEGAGCDLPNGMLPVSLFGPDPAKPPKGFDYWTAADVIAWLEGTGPETIAKIGGLPEEERVGIQIDSKTGTVEQSKLYTARFRSFGERRRDSDLSMAGRCQEGRQAGTPVPRSEADGSDRGHIQYSLVAKASLPNGASIASAGTLGGERRLTVVEQVLDTNGIWPRCPQSLKDDLTTAKHVRMVLATPAHFAGGWKPGWLDRSGSGVYQLPAGIGKVKLELVGAAVDRRIPMSGWGLREDKPRPIRWLVPAGSVYFFKVTGGNPETLWKDAWMKPMSDDEQDRCDGLGLALWGTW